MAEQIEARFAIPSQLIKGHGGVFEVWLDDGPVFSKRGLGRFPDPGEIEATIAQRIGP